MTSSKKLKTIRYDHAMQGILLALGATLIWGTNGPAVRFINSFGVSPLLITLFRLTVSTCIIIFLAPKPRSSLIMPRKAEMRKPLFWLSAVGLISSNLGLSIAFLRISIGLTLILYYTAPIWAMIGAWAIARERPTIVQILALIVSLLGVYFAVWDPKEGLRFDLIGILCALAGGAGYALYLLNGRYGVGKESHFKAYLQNFLWASIICWVVALFTGEAVMLFKAPLKAYLGLLYMALCTSALAFGMISRALKYMSSSIASVVSMTEVPFSMMWAFILLHEVPEKRAVLGGIFICIAVILLSLEPLFYCRDNR